MYYLYIKSLDGGERRVPLDPGTVSIGSSADNWLVLDQFGVSARHAEIEVRGKQVRIRDCDSTNGTLVNGHKVTDAQVKPGDRMLIGSVMVYLLEAISDRILLRQAPPLEAAHRAVREPAEDPETPVFPVKLMDALHPGISTNKGPSDPGATVRLLGEILAHGFGGASDEHLFEHALQTLMRYTHAEAGLLLGIGEDRRRFLQVAIGLGEGESADAGRVEQAIGTRVPQFVGSPDGVRRAQLYLPLISAGRVAGVLYLVAPWSGVSDAGRATNDLGPVLSTLAVAIERHEALQTLDRTRLALTQGVEWPSSDPLGTVIEDDLLGTSLHIRGVLQTLERYAAGDEHLVIRGEPGAGLEQAARRVHLLSRRSGGPFLVVNSATAASDIFDRELFGTSGDGPVFVGKLRLGTGGTIYFDDIAGLSESAQKRLHRVIRRGEVIPIGGKRPRPVDLRLIFGSRVAVPTLVEQGTVLEELASLLVQGPVRMPSLRERREDIVPIAQHLIRRFAARMHKRIVGLSAEACSALTAYSWRGNLLELKQVIERAVLLAEDPIIDLNVLPLEVSEGPTQPTGEGLAAVTGLPWKEAKLMFERIYLNELLEANPTITDSAKRAGIARKNFYNKMKRHGLSRKDG